MEEINKTCEIITDQIRRKLFAEVAVGEPNKFPDLNALVEDQWKLRLRRNLQAWRNTNLPSVVTHLLKDEHTDDLLEAARRTNLLNHPSDPVKIVYHPDFLSPTNPFFGIDYTEFVRGCHLGVFPSYYEPWGYTPLEALASGVAAVTSDLAGFGDYVKQNIPNPDENGVYVVDRYRKTFDAAATQLTEVLHRFVLQTRRDRIEQRYKAETTSLNFDWNRLVRYYEQTYRKAVDEA
jgi:glycogen(starch) synthase